MPLYNHVKQAREELAISQTELGKRCGVSRQTISSIERGDYHPSIVLAIKLAQIFNKSIEELFWLEEEGNEKL
ncbi:MAG: helix-turn-helix transcriptional regulator [Candidatus Niameybacter stercoravium]|nr:helix-turn-helix transcriptional regulator [Candidatus Niameybacter stercoravium]